VIELQRGRPPLSVIAPCHNEEDNLDELVRRTAQALVRAGISGEIVLVDDASTDSTAAVGRLLERVTDRDGVSVRLVERQTQGGIAAAWKSGISSALPVVCVIDADLQYQPEEIPRLYDILLEGRADIVQGARLRSDLPFVRRLVSRGFGAILNLAFAMQLEDNKSGFFVCERIILEDLLRYRGNYTHWQAFAMVAATAKGYSIRETSTPFLPRTAGRSFIDGRLVRTSAACLIDLVVAVAEYGRAARRESRSA
jgi:phenylacetate-CoA ligase